ncbi:hypothetical protein RHMOL_Rhmol09G0162400 [Rhododendron molle]|uniref:Uncharacterized protein n=1 Tax=Rhododendron molle TaxID=49168 RepID=A0ACC0MDZ2_RHOML|nr:hypothetical protein RHMOL_Rhmol09G0162400 [Rhododendron molle]
MCISASARRRGTLVTNGKACRMRRGKSTKMWLRWQKRNLRSNKIYFRQNRGSKKSHVEECLGINGQGNVIDLESHTKIDSCLQVLKNVGFTKGVVQLKDLRQYLEKTSEADDVFKTIFALYILGCFLCPNTKAGVTRSFTKAVSDVREMGKQNWAKLTLQFLCKGIQYQRDNHHVQPSGCLFLLVVFYLERVSPSVKPSIRKLPSLVVWGDDEIRSVLHQFDKIGGYDREGVVVHFTEVGEASSKEGGLSQISTADVQTMTSTFVTVAALLLRQNMFMSNLLGTEMKCNPQEQRGEEMDANHVQLFGQAAALLKGLQSCQSSPPTAFETHDLAIKESKGLSTNPSLGTHIGFEIPSWGHLEVEMGEEIDLHPLDPSARSSPQVTAPNKSETPTPTKFKTPDPVVHKSKGGDTRTDGKRRIPKNMDEDVSSPSPVKGFRSLAGLSRGRKMKLSIGNAIPYVGGYDNVEVQYEAPRLRQHDQLKKSHFQCSPYTKDGVKKRDPPKKQPAYVEDMAADERKRTYEPLTDHEKLFTEFIFDIRDPSNGDSYVHLKMFGTERFFATQFELCSLKPRTWILDTIVNLVAVQMTNAERLHYPDKRHLMWYLPRHILDNPNMSESDLKKLCDGYFGDANFTSDIRSCSMLEGLHRALVCQYGDLYQVDVTKFNIATVERQPLQDDTDGYDCGLFVIKFMQGLITHQMNDTERPRLLMELCADENNRDALEVMRKFDAWKAGREVSVQRNRNVTLLIHYGGKLVQTPFRYIGGHVGECTPITGRMSYFELRDVINETGCSNLVRVFYQLTSTNGEIRLVLVDRDVRMAEMFDLYGRGGKIHIYLDDPLWSDESESDSQNQRGIRNPSALRTTGKVRRRESDSQNQRGGQSTSARGRGRGSGIVRRTGRGRARGDSFARGAATGKGQ